MRVDGVTKSSIALRPANYIWANGIRTRHLSIENVSANQPAIELVNNFQPQTESSQFTLCSRRVVSLLYVRGMQTD